MVGQAIIDLIAFRRQARNTAYKLLRPPHMTSIDPYKMVSQLICKGADRFPECITQALQTTSAHGYRVNRTSSSFRSLIDGDAANSTIIRENISGWRMESDLEYGPSGAMEAVSLQTEMSPFH